MLAATSAGAGSGIAAALGRVGAWLLRPGWRYPSSVSVEIDRHPRDAGQFAALLPADGARGPLELVLSGDLVLRRPHQLPAKARAQAGKVLALQLKALSPPGRDDFLAGWYRAGKAAGGEAYVQLVARTSDVEALMRFAADLGVTVRLVRARADDRTVLLLDNRRMADRGAVLWWLGLGGLAVAAFLGLNVVATANRLALGREVEAAQAGLAALQAETDRIITSRSEADAANAAVAEDARLFTQDARPLPWLVDLTRGLPQDAWLASVSMEARWVTLAGSTAGEASDVIQALDGLSWVEGVELVQPLSVDPMSGSTNFEIALSASPGVP